MTLTCFPFFSLSWKIDLEFCSSIQFFFFFYHARFRMSIERLKVEILKIEDEEGNEINGGNADLLF